MTSVRYEISGSGQVDLDEFDIEGKTLEEIEQYLLESVTIEVHEQGNFNIRLFGVEEAVEKLGVGHDRKN